MDEASRCARSPGSTSASRAPASSRPTTSPSSATPSAATSATVQEALEELFERRLHIGTCTITVTPGDDLDAAVAALPAEGGELCFEAGDYPLRTPLVIRDRTRVVVHGAGPATVIRARATEAALVFENCSAIAVRSLRVEGGLPETAAAREHLNGAITFVGGGEVSVSDCDLSCPDAQPDANGDIRRGQTCLTARGDAEPLRFRVEQNRLDVGTLQTGVLLVDPAHAFVAGNRVRVAGARDLTTGRVADGGIVVAGRTVGTVEILDNLVEQTIQGIHIAASGADAGREAADAVLVSRNVVHERYSAPHNRGRHAVFVGNAPSVHVKDTIATLERTGQQSPTPVDAIRLHGVFGPFVAIRQTKPHLATSPPECGSSRSTRCRARACGSSPRRWRTAARWARRRRRAFSTSATTPSTPSWRSSRSRPPWAHAALASRTRSRRQPAMRPDGRSQEWRSTSPSSVPRTVARSRS